MIATANRDSEVGRWEAGRRNYLEDAGRLFKAIYDRSARSGRRVKVVISGSSSIEVHTHLKESLAGRRVTYRIFPLTSISGSATAS